jgi:hypothetical protein
MPGEQTPQRYPRQPVSLFVGLGKTNEPPGRTRNMSMSGLFLETAARPAVESLVDLWFVWGEDTFVGKARVIRHAKDGVGLAFVEPDSLFLSALAEILGIAPPG